MGNTVAFLLHCLQPAGWRWDVPHFLPSFAVVDAKAAVRPGPDTDVIAASPNVEVMSALGARAGMVGNFVGGQACRRQYVLSGFE